jgi:hypothetical protein
MRLAPLFLLSLLLLVACSPENKAPGNSLSDPEMLRRAAVAERNLVKMRDAAIAYYARHKRLPEFSDELAEFKAGPKDLEASDDYDAELGYGFLNLKFSADGKLERGWFFATPRGTSDALKVRMNGVSGNFDHVRNGEPFLRAPDDEGWKEGELPANKDKGITLDG